MCRATRERDRRAREALAPETIAKHFAELPPAVNAAVDTELALKVQGVEG